MASDGGPGFPPSFTAWQAPYKTVNQAFGELSGTTASELAWKGPKVLPLQNHPHNVSHANLPPAVPGRGLMPKLLSEVDI